MGPERAVSLMQAGCNDMGELFSIVMSCLAEYILTKVQAGLVVVTSINLASMQG